MNTCRREASRRDSAPGLENAETVGVARRKSLRALSRASCIPMQRKVIGEDGDELFAVRNRRPPPGIRDRDNTHHLHRFRVNGFRCRPAVRGQGRAQEDGRHCPDTSAAPRKFAITFDTP
jgi:hypothetical protein